MPHHLRDKYPYLYAPLNKVQPGAISADVSDLTNRESPTQALRRESAAQGWNAHREFTQRAFEEHEAGEITYEQLRHMCAEVN